MASLFRSTLPLRKTKVNNFLSLPPTLRSRAFHATSRRPIYNETIQFTHTILESVHSISHTPWGLTIPLVALLVRGAFILPIALRTRQTVKKQVELMPLIQAWSHAINKEAKREVGNRGQGEVEAFVKKGMRKKRVELYKRNGVAPWKSLIGLVQIPVFLGVMETLRVMVGSREGFLGLMRSFWMDSKTESGDTTVITGDGLTSIPPVPVETSLSTEGILWFPDLLVADPQLYLPFILSSSMLLNIYTSIKLLPAPEGTDRTKNLTTRISGLVALAVGPLLLGFPSALMLYLISSSMLNWLQTLLLTWWIPVPDPQQAVVAKKPWKTGLGLKTKDVEKA